MVIEPTLVKDPTSPLHLNNLESHVKVFGFLNKVRNIHRTEIRKQIVKLEATLTVITMEM